VQNQQGLLAKRDEKVLAMPPRRLKAAPLQLFLQGLDRDGFQHLLAMDLDALDRLVERGGIEISSECFYVW
jgi:hypothetical protein